MIHRICFFALTFVLSACVSVLPEQQTPEALYRVSPPAVSVSLTENVMVREPDAPRLFAGRAIATEDSDGALRLLPGAEWADRSTRLMQTALIDTFGASDTGTAMAADGSATARHELDWRIVDLHLRRTEAVCQVVVSLYDRDARVIVGRATLSATVPAATGRNGARVGALREAATDCVAQTARFVADTQVASTPMADLRD
ncbi:MAG: ABC-type transport auxiliary lipoprotein family protein [Pseudomonadota bacterium]